MQADAKCTDPIILNLWHAIGDIEDMRCNTAYQTVLLGEPVGYALDATGLPSAWRSQPGEKSGVPFEPKELANQLPAKSMYGCLWTCLGKPASDIFPIPEYFEANRRNSAPAQLGLMSQHRGRSRIFSTWATFPMCIPMSSEPNRTPRSKNTTWKLVPTAMRLLPPDAAFSNLRPQSPRPREVKLNMSIVFPILTARFFTRPATSIRVGSMSLPFLRSL